MKILHVASFRGNVGDNANHAGFRPWWEGLIGRRADWVEFEIRDVYRKQRAFDEKFANQANDCDLIVWGGGNYFELWVEQSPTGTSLAITDEVLSSIKTPMFFNALGVDDAQGFTPETLSRFKRFLHGILSSSQCIVTVRNDGAMGALKVHASDLPLDRVLPLPDGGFFARYPAKLRVHSGLSIGINLAGDMLARRFPGGSHHTSNSFLSELAEWMTRRWTVDANVSFVLLPHIYSDLQVCAALLELLPDQLRRERVRVAAYDAGSHAAATIFGEYRACDVILGMRFHANVVPIGHGIPTIALCSYTQVQRLYRELSIPEYCVDVTLPNYASALNTIFDGITASPSSVRSTLGTIRDSLVSQRDVQAIRISTWLAGHNLIGK
jgi:polysaccharide pyruvyl transferase WcaK-like protein